jgi:hypothetical protein
MCAYCIHQVLCVITVCSRSLISCSSHTARPHPCLVLSRHSVLMLLPSPPRQEELDPSAQGAARPELRRVQQPGERHHPGDCQVRPRDGAAGRAGAARWPFPAPAAAAGHLGHRHLAAGSSHELLPAGCTPTCRATGARLAAPCAPHAPRSRTHRSLSGACAHCQSPRRACQPSGAADLALWRCARLARGPPCGICTTCAPAKSCFAPVVRLTALAAPRCPWACGFRAPGQQLHPTPGAHTYRPGRCAQPGPQGLGLVRHRRWPRPAGLCALAPLIQLVTLAWRPAGHRAGRGRHPDQSHAMRCPGARPPTQKP